MQDLGAAEPDCAHMHPLLVLQEFIQSVVDELCEKDGFLAEAKSGVGLMRSSSECLSRCEHFKPRRSQT